MQGLEESKGTATGSIFHHPGRFGTQTLRGQFSMWNQTTFETTAEWPDQTINRIELICRVSRVHQIFDQNSRPQVVNEHEIRRREETQQQSAPKLEFVYCNVEGPSPFTLWSLCWSMRFSISTKQISEKIDFFPWFTKPSVTGPVWPVTGQTGPDRYWFGPVWNRPNFKIWIWINKNEKFSKNS